MDWNNLILGVLAPPEKLADMSELESGHAETSEPEHYHDCWICGGAWQHSEDMCCGSDEATCPRCEE